MSAQQIALITGATGRIGRSLLKGFATRGCRVIALDHAPQPAHLECWAYQRAVARPSLK